MVNASGSTQIECPEEKSRIKVNSNLVPRLSVLGKKSTDEGVKSRVEDKHYLIPRFFAQSKNSRVEGKNNLVPRPFIWSKKSRTKSRFYLLLAKRKSNHPAVEFCNTRLEK